MFNATKFYRATGATIVVTTPEAAAALGPEWFDSPKAAAKAVHDGPPTKASKAAAKAHAAAQA